MLKELAQYIENQTTYTIGADLFAGEIPSSARPPYILIKESPGSVRDFNLVDRLDAMIQVVVHQSSYMKAREVANEIADLFHGNCGISLPVLNSGDTALEIASGTLTSGPYMLGFDDYQNQMASINLLLVIQNL